MRGDRGHIEALSSVIDLAPILVGVLDGEGRYVAVQGAWRELLGWSPEEVLGKTPAEFMHEEDRQTLTVAVEETKESRGRRRVALRMRCKNGSYRWMARFGAGAPIDGKLIGIAVDVTEERSARQEAMLHKEHLRAILEAVPDYITEIDRDARITFINRTYPGVTVEQVVGTNLMNWLAPEARELFAAAIRRILDGGGPEVVVVAGSGEAGPTYYESRLVGIHEGSHRTGVTIVGRDITRERLAELERRNRTRLEVMGLISGSVAHDLNNFLTVVRFAADAAESACTDGDLSAARQAIGDILTAAVRSSDLAQQLLAYGREKAQHGPIDLCGAVGAARSLLERLLGGRFRLELAVPTAPLHIPLSVLELHQILANLASNARNAMPRGGTIRCAVRAGAEGDPLLRSGQIPGAVLSFADDGPGIALDVQRRIFEPFFTGAPDRGTGLGLATVYAIVQDARGEVALQSSPNEGATFTFYFPTVGAEVRELPAAAARLRGTETILVVDDEVTIRTLASRYLSRLGYRTMEASNADEAEAVAKAHEKPIDLLLTDLRMPGRDGIELHDALKVELPGLPVLFMTGDVLERDIVRIGEAPVLRKPASLQELAEAVRAALDAPRRPLGPSTTT